MIVKYDNRSITNHLTEKATLKGPAIAGSNVSLLVDSNNGFSENDYVIIGRPEQSRTEIALINAAVVQGTEIQVDSLASNHNPYESMTRLTHNMVRIYTADTETGTKTFVKEKVIDVDQRYTEFEISDGTIGFVFFTLYNEEDDTESGYSQAIKLEEEERDNYQYVWDFCNAYLADEEEIKKDTFKLLAETAQDEIYGQRNWSFREGTATFDVSAGTTLYDIKTDCNIYDFGSLLSARTETEQLQIINSDMDDNLMMNSLSLSPYSICVYGGNFHIYVSGNETITIKYHKNPQAMLTAGTKIGTSIVSALGFAILESYYMTRDTDLSSRFERRKLIAIKNMIKADEKYSARVTRMPRNTGGAYRDVSPIIAD